MKGPGYNPDTHQDLEYIHEIAKHFGVSVRHAHRLAERYEWPFIFDGHGYKLYRWDQIFWDTPGPDQRRREANEARRRKGKARYAKGETLVRETAAVS